MSNIDTTRQSAAVLNKGTDPRPLHTVRTLILKLTGLHDIVPRCRERHAAMHLIAIGAERSRHRVGGAQKKTRAGITGMADAA